MLKTILEFSSNKSTIKYSSSHLKVFISIVRKREQFADNNCLTKKDFDEIFAFLKIFFQNEASSCEKYDNKKTFLTHWSYYTHDLADLYSLLLNLYCERYLNGKMLEIEKNEVDNLINLDIDANLILYNSY